MIGSDQHAFTAPLITSVGKNWTSDGVAMADLGVSGSQRVVAGSKSARPTVRRRTGNYRKTTTGALLLSLLSVTPTVTAECYTLSNSTQCSAFQEAYVSTSDYLVGLYPFLQYVSDTASFDEQLSSFVQTSYVQEKYQTLLGCNNVDLTNTTELYARFTTSVICNAIVQNSIDDCDLSGTAAKPLCAESCAQFAESEAYVVADSNICSDPSSNNQSQIRADFTNCALPANSLSTANCIDGIDNEPLNCGYGNSTIGLCTYCASGGINSTDTCCYNSNAETRCAGVVLPSIRPSVTFTATATSTATGTAVPATGNTNNGLSGGAIAGIVVGSVIGVALLAFLVFICLRLARRRNSSQKGSIFNQPSPSRKGQSTTQLPPPTPPQGYEILPGGRIARMSALEGHSGDSPSRPGDSRRGESRRGESRRGGSAGAATAGAAAGYMTGRRRGDNLSSSISGDSPESETRMGVLRPPPTSRRNGSLSSNSIMAGEDAQSPTSAGGMSSPQGVASQQSEQLPFFKDYYSQDDIHPGDRVAVLWAYQPRAADEFALERGDMLKVVGIWDDGWATGVMMEEHADEWEARRQAQRDSGVSNTSGRGRDTSPPVTGEIKAFPLVCVCLPEHWRKTIEGDGSTETASSAHQGSQLT